jgi:RecG-like helicase
VVSKPWAICLHGIRFVTSTAQRFTPSEKSTMNYLTSSWLVDWSKSNLLGNKRNNDSALLLRDSSGIVELVWFQGIKYVQDKIRPGMDFLVFGKPANFHGTWNIPHPDIELYSAEKAATSIKASACIFEFGSHETRLSGKQRTCRQ